jgi:hypothetical protein
MGNENLNAATRVGFLLLMRILLKPFNTLAIYTLIDLVCAIFAALGNRCHQLRASTASLAFIKRCRLGALTHRRLRTLGHKGRANEFRIGQADLGAVFAVTKTRFWKRAAAF